MEVEHDRSQFSPRGELITIMTQESGDSSSLFLYKWPHKASRELEKIFPPLYKWLDSLAGEKSYRFALPDRDYQVFNNIFNLLKSEGVARDISVGWHRYNDVPAFLRCDISATFPTGSTDGATNYQRAFAHGFGKNISTVLSKAIGEFLERYFLMVFHKKKFLRGSYSSLSKKGFSAINPSDFAGFTDDQKEKYTKRKFSTESIFYWQKVRRVSDGADAFLPAQFIHWNYDVTQEENEPALIEINTNGAGGGFSNEEAILSGIYELIQRDAFLIYWLNGLKPPKIRPESVHDGEFQRIFTESKRYGFECHCLNTTLDIGVPSFVVVIIDSSGKGPYFSLGGGCEADPAKALRRALEEAWSVYYWLRPLPPYKLPDDYQPYNDATIDQEKRLRLAANIAMAGSYQFFLNGGAKNLEDYTWNYPAHFSTKREELSSLVKRIENLGPGYEVFFYLAEHPILKRLGYSSARVVVPKLIPLYLRETIAPLGASRLRNVPLQFGFHRSEALNPLPHPFP